jgi:hypothetical protein
MAKWASFAELVAAKQQIDRDAVVKDLITALRFYADNMNYAEWGEGEGTAIQHDEGDRARAILRKLGAM